MGEDLDMKEERETDGSVENDNDHVVTKSPQIPSSIELFGMAASPAMLINYFTTIDRHQAGWENIEDLNEDAAIAAFLSSRVSAPVLSEGDLAEVEDDVICNARSYSTVSQEIVTDKSKLISHKDEENGNQRKHAESITSLNRQTCSSSYEETDDEQSELSKTQSNDLRRLEGFEREANQNKSTSIPKIVGTINRHEKE